MAKVTSVYFEITKQTEYGVTVPDLGKITFTPSRARVKKSDISELLNDELVLPAPFTISNLDTQLVQLDVTDGTWCWKIEGEHESGESWRVWVTVPELPEDAEVPMIAFTDLPRVDPKSLKPSADPLPIWWTELERVRNEAISGAMGPEGPQGLPGLPGKDGADGLDGLPGPAGEDGLPGRDGIDGKDGADGRDGEPGKDGRDGADGLPGERGLDGLPGNDGKDGADGLPGPEGPPGKDGERGPEGPQGLPGLPGKDGAPGGGSSGPGTTITGEGFPEGIVYANRGDYYVDTLATSGAIRWVKTTPATTNMGWTVESGDTGIIYKTGVLTAGWSHGASYWRRTDRGVSIVVTKIVRTTTAIKQQRIITIPATWLPNFGTTSYGHSFTLTAFRSNEIVQLRMIGANILVNSEDVQFQLPDTPAGAEWSLQIDYPVRDNTWPIV